MQPSHQWPLPSAHMTSKMMSIRRRCCVIQSMRRHYDVMLPAGFNTTSKIKAWQINQIFGGELFCLKQQSDCWFSYDGPYMIPWDYFSQENTKFHRQSFGLSKALKTLNFMITVCEQIILITLIMHTELDKNKHRSFIMLLRILAHFFHDWYITKTD